MEQKKCSRCKKVKNISEFHNRFSGYCIICSKEYSRNYYKNKEKKKKNKQSARKFLYRRYKITEEEFNNLLEKQNYVCAICKEKCVTFKNLCIDHDHKTGKVRGLLCLRCNKGLGDFRDNIDLLKNAIIYLKKK